MISEAVLDVFNNTEDFLRRSDFNGLYAWMLEHLNDYPINTTGELTTELLRLCRKQLEDNLVGIPDYFLYNTNRPFYEIPKGVHFIGSKAFSGCAFTNLVIPSNVMIIQSLACSYMPKLEEVLIEEGCTIIGSEAFLSNYKLKEVTIPKSVNLIERNVFNECPNVTLLVHQGSHAERYARHNGLRYELL